jgi:hypothetical protein
MSAVLISAYTRTPHGTDGRPLTDAAHMPKIKATAEYRLWAMSTGARTDAAHQAGLLTYDGDEDLPDLDAQAAHLAEFITWMIPTRRTLPNGQVFHTLPNAPNDVHFAHIHDGSEYAICSGWSHGDSPSDSLDVLSTVEHLATFADPIDTTRCLHLTRQNIGTTPTLWLCQRDDAHDGDHAR